MSPRRTLGRLLCVRHGTEQPLVSVGNGPAAASYTHTTLFKSRERMGGEKRHEELDGHVSG